MFIGYRRTSEISGLQIAAAERTQIAKPKLRALRKVRGMGCFSAVLRQRASNSQASNAA